MLYIATAGLLQACASQSTPPCVAVPPQPVEPKALLTLACPSELDPLADDSMGSMANALMAAAETYHACRAAALAL